MNNQSVKEEMKKKIKKIEDFLIMKMTTQHTQIYGTQ